MNTGARWQKLDTALVAVNRPTEGQPDPASSADKTPDLGAVYGESRTHGAEAGRVPRGTDLCHFIASWKDAAGEPQWRLVSGAVASVTTRSLTRLKLVT